MTDKIPIAIIGGGVLGLAVAYTLLNRGHRNIVLFEKNDGFGLEQSGRNSGVIHAGFLYQTGTSMAKLCVQGVPLLIQFCQEHSVPHAQTGKLMVATHAQQENELQKYFRLAVDNGLQGVEILTAAETKKREPCLQVHPPCLYPNPVF